VGRNERNAYVHGSLAVGRRFGRHQLLREVEQRTLFAPRASQQGAHGNSRIGLCLHKVNLSFNLVDQAAIARCKTEETLILRHLER
jgi:hypothetical protein